MLLMHQKNYAKAVPVLQKCIQLSPENTSFYFGLSRALLNLGQPEPARNAVRYAIQLKPHEAILYDTLGNTYAMQNDIPNAIKAVLKAVELDPEFPYYYLNLAKLYKQMGQQNRAEEHYQLYEHFKRKTSR